MKKVIVVMGSDSDLQVMEGALKTLGSFNVPFEVRIVSAHRTPAAAEELSKTAEQSGAGVIIAAAGKAAHLAGVMAANTVLPVIGVPIKSSTMDGLDSLLSTVQMPSGIPVATVGVNGGENAGLLALQILGVKYPEIAGKLADYKLAMRAKINSDDAALQAELKEL